MYRRCTLINFLTDDLKGQHNAPSPLPDNFKDCFSEQDWFITRHRLKRYSVDEWADLVGTEVGCIAGVLQHSSLPHSAKTQMRAAMRHWGRYRYAGYAEALKRLCVYEEYMLEIAAQVEHDREFRQLLSAVHNGDIVHFIF